MYKYILTQSDFFLLFLSCTKTMATTTSPFEKNTDAFTFSIMDYFYNYFNVQKLFLFKLKTNITYKFKG